MSVNSFIKSSSGNKDIHALLFLPDTQSFVVLNSKSDKKKEYQWLKEKCGDWAIFVGWL